MSELGYIIKGLREKRNLTQQELALKIHVGTHILDKFETGEKTPDIGTLLHLAAVLEVPARDLAISGKSSKASGLEAEIEQLINQIGRQKAVWILRKITEWSEEDMNRILEEKKGGDARNYV
ncbi:helix-turn-helix domain-containing protein [Peribacillus sp. SCS-26]|uniref:helix-turn-helix domain-containing protein n=1 Tax=Paraperibacillus marinus TaxID=3115295 RepID=UPI003906335A